MYSDRDLIQKLGTVGRAFFGQGFSMLTEIQRNAIEPVFAGHNVLVSSATASGKTEAVFAPMLARLLKSNVNDSRVRILVIAPTRALVNDLFFRLEGPLENIGWRCGRQTSDYRDKHKRPELLITTPESFDSMLVRDGESRDGQSVDHLLAYVEAVFIDEVHLFDGSSRGDQLSWLLRRLERIKRFAYEKGLINTSDLQICGASATIPSPELLAQRLLGPHSIVVSVRGSRSMEILGGDSNDWKSLHADLTPAKIRIMIFKTREDQPILDATEGIWRALATPVPDGSVCRKLLVFVPTRRLCDQLSSQLKDVLPKRRDLQVLAHHGSLERPAREHAERTFACSRDAILVATTTLEVGIDIGNVDAVVLVGPPSNTSSLLQRVGRAGRRSGVTRIVPIARDWVECCAFGSLLAEARDGAVSDTVYAARWSVFVQQAASFIAQAPKSRRSKDSIISLANAIWPESQTSRTPERILEHLCSQEQLIEKNDWLHLGEQWSDRLAEGGGTFHHNLDTEGTGRPVVDASTGEIIAHVQGFSGASGTLVLGGQKWDLVSHSDEILLKPSKQGRNSETFQYSFRRAPVRLEFAHHTLLGLGFADNDAPIIDLGDRSLWLHCGGSAFEAALSVLFSGTKRCKGLEGLAMWQAPQIDQLENLLGDKSRIIDIVSGIASNLTFALSPGPYHSSLPNDVQTEVVLSLFDIQGFIRWLETRRIFYLDATAVAGTPITMLIESL